jgi:hypothetical protein
MKEILTLLFLAFVAGCNPHEKGEKEVKKEVKQDTLASPAKYSNQRFRDVTVEKTGGHTFLIKGKAQVFEASFSWVIEDGHDELDKGHQMTDAGAPDWGNFSFTVTAPKERSNSTLHVVLFEVSAKNGSRQHELPVFLY